MNITQELLAAMKSNPNSSADYARNLLKEVLQDYALNFIYSGKYKFLIFTGGTCLKKNYGLNRLSEDLDFDYESAQTLDIKLFALELTQYFMQLGMKKVGSKISGNGNTVTLKFDFSQWESQIDLGMTSSVVYLRVDFSKIEYSGYELTVSPISTPNFSFFVRSYDLSTLFANKLVAFLQRDFYKGKEQKLPLKGRDVYDIFWLTSKSVKAGGDLRPNGDVLVSRLAPQSLSAIRNEVMSKLNLVDPKYVYEDLSPLVSSREYLDSFVKQYKKYLLKNLPTLLS